MAGRKERRERRRKEKRGILLLTPSLSLPLHQLQKVVSVRKKRKEKLGTGKIYVFFLPR